MDSQIFKLDCNLIDNPMFPWQLKYYQVFCNIFKFFFFWVLILIKRKKRRKKKCFHPCLFDITTTYIIIVSSLYMPIKTNYIMFEISFFLVACTWLCICITMHRWVKKEKKKKRKWFLSEIWKFCFLVTASQNVWNSKTCSTYFRLSNI